MRICEKKFRHFFHLSMNYCCVFIFFCRVNDEILSIRKIKIGIEKNKTEKSRNALENRWLPHFRQLC